MSERERLEPGGLESLPASRPTDDASGLRSRVQPNHFLLVAGLLFGLSLCVLTPPFAVPDEPAHLFRAWSVSHGHWLAQKGGAAVPRSYIRLAAFALEGIRGPHGQRFGLSRFREMERIPLERNELTFVPIPADSWRQPLQYTAGSYSPIGYAGSALGVAFATLLRIPPLWHLYAARLGNLLLAIFLIRFAIGRAPFARWIIALCALLPMSMYLQASASLDAVTIAMAMVVIAETLRFVFTPGQNVGGMAISSFLLGLIKPGYLLVPMLVLLAARDRRRWPSILAAVGSAVSGSLLAAVWSSHALTPNPSIAIEPWSRLRTALHHPLSFLLAAADNWSESLTIRLTEMVGTLGWLDAPMPLPFALLALAGIALLGTGDGPAPRGFRGGARLVPCILFGGTVGAITLMTHLYSPAPYFALAIQGRYFLPALPLLFLPLTGRVEQPNWLRTGAYVLTALFVAQTWFTELLRFYL